MKMVRCNSDGGIIDMSESFAEHLAIELCCWIEDVGVDFGGWAQQIITLDDLFGIRMWPVLFGEDFIEGESIDPCIDFLQRLKIVENGRKIPIFILVDRNFEEGVVSFLIPNKISEYAEV